MILNLSRGITSLLLKLTKLVGNHFAGQTAESISSAFLKSQDKKEATTLSLCHIVTNNLLYESR